MTIYDETEPLAIFADAVGDVHVRIEHAKKTDNGGSYVVIEIDPVPGSFRGLSLHLAEQLGESIRYQLGQMLGSTAEYVTEGLDG